MKTLLKLVSSVFIFFILIILSPNKTSASEGQFRLANTVNDTTRCYAISVLLSTNQYHVVVTCRNLIYPSDELNSKYILWSRSGAEFNKLGSLALGKASFNTKESFNQLFVSLEQDDKVKSPSTRVVMRGDLEEIDFLDEISTPTQKPVDTSNSQEIISTDETELTPTPGLTTRQKLIIGLKRSSIIAAIALLGLIGLVFVITRSK